MKRIIWIGGEPWTRDEVPAERPGMVRIRPATRTEVRVSLGLIVLRYVALFVAGFGLTWLLVRGVR